MQSPLAVRVRAGQTSRSLDVSDLEFARIARGGFASATFTLPAWVSSTDPALTPLARVTVDDTRTAEPVFEGYLDIPGKNRDRGRGDAWQIGASGAQTVLGDRHRAYIGIDTDLSAFYRRYRGSPGSTAEASSSPADENVDALVMQFPGGQSIANNAYASLQYDRIRDAGQKVGGFAYAYQAGLASTDYRMQSLVTAPLTTIRDHPFATALSTNGASAGPTFASDTFDRVVLRIIRATGGATNVATDSVWGAFSNVMVRAQLRLQDGSWLAGANTYVDYFVRAHQAVVDALWWFTNRIDIPGAAIDTTWTHQIDQLAYPDGTRLPDLLADLALLEPDMIWEVGEANAAGLHRFTLRRWPTDVRYEADSIDGWSQPGGEVNLSNSLRMFWTNRRGKVQSSTYSTTVAELDQWSRVRDAEPVTLAAELGSQAAADRIGPELLAQLATTPFAGTLTVARPIRDLYTGRSVMPWEIVPGYLVNVRDVDGPPMRLTEMSYRDSDQAATLTLGTPVYSMEELVNKLMRQQARPGGVRTSVAYR